VIIPRDRRAGTGGGQWVFGTLSQVPPYVHTPWGGQTGIGLMTGDIPPLSPGLPLLKGLWERESQGDRA
jgi:hypothetical protein